MVRRKRQFLFMALNFVLKKVNKMPVNGKELTDLRALAYTAGAFNISRNI
jgi:hypothetical protein